MENKNFGEFLKEIQFKNIDACPEFDKMKLILDYIETLNISKDNFNENKGMLSKILLILSKHVFSLWLNKNENFPKFPGVNDFNLSLDKSYFNYNLYENFYKPFLENIKILVDSDGKTIPRYFLEIKKKKDKNNKIYFVKIINIYIERKDFPEGKIFNKCIFDKYFQLKGNGKCGSLEEYENYYLSAYKEKGIEKFKKFKEEEYPILNELYNNKEKYENLENISI